MINVLTEYWVKINIGKHVVYGISGSVSKLIIMTRI